MLALDSTIGCIEASESDVLDLYRCDQVASTGSPAAPPQRLEAYVCAVKKKTQVRVYLALVADDRKIYVYCKPGKPDHESGFQETVQEALGYARAMGFTPQRVDLSYSPAMREVVVRNTKILRPPGSKIGAFLKHGLPGAPLLPIAPAPPTPVPGPAPLQQACSPDPSQIEKEFLELERTNRSLKKDLAAVAAERDANLLRLQQATEQQQALAAQLAAATDERDTLSVQREELARCKEQWESSLPEKEAMERKLRDLQEQNQLLLAQCASAGEETARFFAEREALAQAADRADGATSELNRLREELSELKTRYEQRSRQYLEIEDERAALVEGLSGALTKVEAVTAQRDEALKTSERLQEEIRGAGAQAQALRSELEGVKAEQRAGSEQMEGLKRELAAMQQQTKKAERDAAALRKELARAAAEDANLPEKEPEPDLHATVARAPSEIEAGTVEQTADAAPTVEADPRPAKASYPAAKEANPPGSTGVTQAPGSAQMADRERDFAHFSALAEQAPSFDAMPEIPPFDATPAELTAPEREAAVFPPFGAAPDDFFSAQDDGQPVGFQLEPGLGSIEYAHSDEVVEMYQSINNANLAPEGKGQENCRGYICCLKKGLDLSVFAAIHGIQSGRTRVYLPEQQPKDESCYVTTVKGAIAFAEEVGLMMEPVRLDSPATRQDYLRNCPALREVAQG